MNEFKIVFKQHLNDIQKKDIWNLLVLTDHEFVPALSERSSTTQKNLLHAEIAEKNLPTIYYENLLLQQFLLVVDQDKVIGFMSYLPDYNIELSNNEVLLADYISTVIVHPDYRSNGITERLYCFLMQQKKSGIIATRTWSTNHAHLRVLQKMGFKNIETIINDRGEGIDTVYYAKTL